MNKKDIQDLVLGFIAEFLGYEINYTATKDNTLHEIGLEPYQVNKIIDLIELELNFNFCQELLFDGNSTIETVIERTHNDYNMNYL